MTNSLIRGLVVGGLICSFAGVVVADDMSGMSTTSGDTPATAASDAASGAAGAATNGASTTPAKAKANAKAKAKKQTNNGGTSSSATTEQVVDVPDPEDLGSD